MKLVEFVNEYAAGGIITNDRGNGSGGPGYIAEGTKLPRIAVTPVTEAEDPEAWRLAREAMAAHDIRDEPSAVAIGEERHSGERLVSNPHQMIYAV